MKQRGQLGIVISILMGVTVSVFPGWARDYYVATNGNHTTALSWSTAYTNIQTALDALADGDRIVVAGQVFALPAALTWTGRQNNRVVGGFQAANDGQAPGTPDPALWPTWWMPVSGPESRVLTMTAVTNAALENIILAGGRLSGSALGAGVWATNSTVSFLSCTFYSNQISFTSGEIPRGAGIAVAGGSASFSNCLFHTNLLIAVSASGGTGRGGGLYATDATVDLRECIFTNNVVQYTVNQYGRGAGAFIFNGTARIDRCLFTANRLQTAVLPNTGDGFGAGLYLERCQATLATNRFDANINNCNLNQGSFGAALYVNSGTTTVDECLFQANRTVGRSGKGGAVYVTGSASGLHDFYRCVFNVNTALTGGGAVYFNNGRSTLRNCLVVSNGATLGGGGVWMEHASNQLQNCTIVDNTVQQGGAGLQITAGAVTNCIVYHNYRAYDQSEWNVEKTGGAFDYSCASPPVPGVNNTDALPDFKDRAGGDYRLKLASPCEDTGVNLDWMAGAYDLSGTNARIIGGTADRGAYETESRAAGAFRGNFVAPVTYALDYLDAVFEATVAGAQTNGAHYAWDFNTDGLPDRSGFGLAVVTQGFGVSGTNDISIWLTVSNVAGEVQTIRREGYLRVAPSVIYVATNGAHTVGTNWATAFRDLQTAVNLTRANQTILLAGHDFGISNYIYMVGLSNLVLRGGYAATGGSPGERDSAIWPSIIRRVGGTTRVFDILNCQESRLEGLTIADGNPNRGNGGGLVMDLSRVTLDSCVFTNNVLSDGTANAYNYGGGLHCANSVVSVYRCVFVRNRMRSTAPSNNNRAHGGGLSAVSGTVGISNCLFLANDADSWGHHGSQGGALYLSGGPHVVRSCLLTANRSGVQRALGLGGGVYMVTGLLESVTIVANTNMYPDVGYGGGIYRQGGFVTNAIIYDNTTTGLTDNIAGSLSAFAYSCAPDLISGEGNITNGPMFTDPERGDYRLMSLSPCVDSGYLAPWMNTARDLGGLPRLQRRLADMGAYEAIPQLPAILWRVF